MRKLLIGLILAGLVTVASIAPAFASHQWCDGGDCAPIARGK